MPQVTETKHIVIDRLKPIPKNKIFIDYTPDQLEEFAKNICEGDKELDRINVLTKRERRA